MNQIAEILSPDKVFLIAFFLLVGFPIHEFMHAFAAYRLGDATAKMFGRLTLNPISHFDPFGGLLLVVSILAGGIAFGWAKPTPVNPNNLVDRRNGEVIVSLAGPASNLVTAALAAIVFRIVWPMQAVPDVVIQILFLGVFFSVSLAIFNLLPIPPLDGSAVLYRLLPARYEWQIRPFLAQYGVFVLLIFILFGGTVLSPLIERVAYFLVGV